SPRPLGDRSKPWTAWAATWSRSSSSTRSSTRTSPAASAASGASDPARNDLDQPRRTGSRDLMAQNITVGYEGLQQAANQLRSGRQELVTTLRDLQPGINKIGTPQAR